MQPQTRREPFRASSWSILLCSCLAGALLHGAGAEPNEPLLHLPGSVLLLGYPDDDALSVSRDGEELTLRPPGPKRGGHHTYPSLSRDGTFIATSYVKSPYPHYREGIATYSLDAKQWKQYDGGDFQWVWAITISPDGSTLAFKVQRHGSDVPQLLLLDQDRPDDARAKDSTEVLH